MADVSVGRNPSDLIAFINPEFVEREYNARARVPDHPAYFARWERDSEFALRLIREHAVATIPISPFLHGADAGPVLDEAAFGGATPVTPKFISAADPASRWTGANGGLAFFAYCTNYLIDLKHAVIMDVEATTAVRQAEVTAQRVMLDRTEERFGIWPERLAADPGYGSAENLAWLVHEKGIEPHIPVFDKDRTDGSFARSDFIYNHSQDSYTCPGGKELRQYWQESRAAKAQPPTDGLYRYRARKADCDSCSLRSRCRPGEQGRKLLRSIHEGARDLARDLALTDAYLTSRRERKKVEMLFAHLKRILRLDRLRLRGPNGARDEFHLAAAAQNLRKLAKLIPMPTQPLPASANHHCPAQLSGGLPPNPTPTSSTQSTKSRHQRPATLGLSSVRFQHHRL